MQSVECEAGENGGLFVMEYYFDTSSLVALARYYHPFDVSGRLYEFVFNKFRSGEIVILDTILQEARLTSKGLVISTYPFFAENRDLIVDTKDLMPFSTKRFDNMLNSNFSLPALARSLGPEGFSVMKQQFLKSGDGKLTLTMLNKLHDNRDAEICVVTEETRFGNDGKIFKKIPALCDIIGAKCITLVNYLSQTSFQVTI